MRILSIELFVEHFTCFYIALKTSLPFTIIFTAVYILVNRPISGGRGDEQDLENREEITISIILNTKTGKK